MRGLSEHDILAISYSLFLFLRHDLDENSVDAVKRSMLSRKGLRLNLSVLTTVCIDPFFFGPVVSLGRNVEAHIRPGDVIIIDLINDLASLLYGFDDKLYFIF